MKITFCGAAGEVTGSQHLIACGKLKILLDCGLAREIDLADGITRYEHLYNHQHHDHMVCMQCGKSIEFYNSAIETLQDEASEQLGFKVQDHKLQIYGLCRDCRKL